MKDQVVGANKKFFSAKLSKSDPLTDLQYIVRTDTAPFLYYIRTYITVYTRGLHYTYDIYLCHFW